MQIARLVRADFGSDLPVRAHYNTKEKLIGFLTLVRPIFLIMTPLNAASAAVLAVRGFPSWQLCLIGFITAACAAGGVNIFNRYADRQRDKIIWPWRAIPAGRVSANQSLALTLGLYLISLVLCWVFFNPTAFIILLLAIILGSLYSLILRDKVGYLSLPPIEGLIFLCGWACFSPATLWTPLPWYLYLLGLVWQSGHILAHYVLHVRFEDTGKPIIQTPALFSKPSLKVASGITFGFTILLFLLSLYLIRMTPLSFLYWVPVAIWGAYTLVRCLGFLRASRNNERLHQAWSSISIFRMVISAAILLSVLVYG